ncbi:putative membrane associated protein [Cryptosporidium canis]|uniref:Membrane associated protein n=1 Tax=Cryptosporidium canis TaxID=195482 RepID=A0ABQ8PBD8_9CRYT|nr:putative membrane associated protein [Cryptosporidium canis]KAJ1614981.1 putative membrane associated protein [Cryptosporidium canis]
MHGTNVNVYNRQKPYGATSAGHAFGMTSGLSMQTVQDMAGVSGSYMNADTFSSKDFADPIMFDTKKSFFKSVKFRRFRKRYAGILGFVVLVCFLIGFYLILFSSRHSDPKSSSVASVYEDEHVQFTHEDFAHEKSMLHANERDYHSSDWSDFEDDWLDEHEFMEEEIDDIEDSEHGNSHYARVISGLDHHSQEGSPVETSLDASPEPLKSTQGDPEAHGDQPAASSIDKLPSEVHGVVPPKPLAEIPHHEESIVYFPKTIHLLGRVGEYSMVNGKYSVMMHPYHEDSPWIHGGRLIWYKTGKNSSNNYYIFYEKKLHNWVLTDKFDLDHPSPIAFLPDHGVMPVKGVGKHGCKAQHYWYFKEKGADNAQKLVMDRSVLVTDNGILLDSLPSHEHDKGSSTNQEVIGLRLHKNQIHIDHKYYSDRYSGKHQINNPY